MHNIDKESCTCDHQHHATCVHLDATRISFNLDHASLDHLRDNFDPLRSLFVCCSSHKIFSLFSCEIKRHAPNRPWLLFTTFRRCFGQFLLWHYFCAPFFNWTTKSGNRLFTATYQNTLQPLFIVCPMSSEIVILRLLRAHLTPILLQNAPYH